jgi:hypothetical protein
MSANNLTTQLKIFYEERPARLADFVKTFFPQKKVFDAEKIPIDKLLPTGALAGYRPRGGASNILRFNPGEGWVSRPPVIGVKTSINEELAQTVTVGKEANAPAAQQLLQKYAYIQDQQADAIYTTIAKQCADILVSGKFTPADDKGNAVDDVVDYERDTSLAVSADYSGAGGSIKQISDAYKALKKFGVPSTGLFVLVGSDIMGRLQGETKFMDLLKIQGLNAGKKWVSPDNRVVGTIVSDCLMPGAAVPMTIIAFDEYYTDASGTLTPFMPSKSIIMSSFNCPRFACFGGVFIAENDNGRIYSGDIVTDRFLQKDPDELILRSQSRPLLIPANINHTACFTSSV